MVNVPADRRADTTRFLHVVGQHTKCFFSERFALQKWTPVFRGEDKVKPNLGKRLRHGGFPFGDSNDRAFGPSVLSIYPVPRPLAWAR